MIRCFLKGAGESKTTTRGTVSKLLVSGWACPLDLVILNGVGCLLGEKTKAWSPWRKMCITTARSLIDLDHVPGLLFPTNSKLEEGIKALVLEPEEDKLKILEQMEKLQLLSLQEMLQPRLQDRLYFNVLDDVWHEDEEGKLEERKNVKRCNGLPLVSTLVGGLLREQRQTKIGWEKVLKRMNSHFSRAILELSCHDLPPHLKSCILCLRRNQSYSVSATLESSYRHLSKTTRVLLLVFMLFQGRCCYLHKKVNAGADNRRLGTAGKRTGNNEGYSSKLFR